jgi:alpha-tubulin suppressor-like RCC1 family protein
MSATYQNNLTIAGTLTVQGTGIFSNMISGTITTSFTGFLSGKAVACGFYHTGIVMTDGTVRICGMNDSGQLGQNDVVTRSTVVTVLGTCSQAIAVSCGRYHTAILLNDGTVRVCGRNFTGQLGQNDTANRSTVVSVLGISSQAITVACGRYHTAILLNNGTVRICGLNTSGQLGQNDLANRSTVVSILGISSQAIAVSCGAAHTAILLNDGTVRVCGRNDYGQLGLNNVANRSTVVSVLGICSQAIAVACGLYHTAILLNNGTVRVCGFNFFGQLGQNDLQTTRSTVVSVLGICSQAIAVACGRVNTAILLDDGTVRVCGNNGNGQLGLNDTVTRSTVVSVLGISSQAIAVSYGGYHIAILLNDGTVRVCGRNTNGQLGLNDVANRSTVVSVVNLSSFSPLISTLNQTAFNVPSLVLNSGGFGLLDNPSSSFQLDVSTDNARKLTTSTWTTGSDEALKTNIVLADLDRCVDVVSKLDLKYFKWEIPSCDTHSLGWIAQEVEQFFPKSVITAEAHGISDFKNLNSDQIIKVMWGALKKLRTDLKAKHAS